MTWLFWLFLGLIVGHCNGWVTAHHTVAEECERLGSFYVGSRTFECTKISNKE